MSGTTADRATTVSTAPLSSHWRDDSNGTVATSSSTVTTIQDQVAIIVVLSILSHIRYNAGKRTTIIAITNIQNRVNRRSPELFSFVIFPLIPFFVM